MQFVATTGCLYGLRRCSLVFFIPFIIQLMPFLIALRRKNLLSKNFIVTVYGFTLLFLLMLNHYEYSTYAAHGLTSFGCQIFIAGAGALSARANYSSCSREQVSFMGTVERVDASRSSGL
jgi:hypothetical protein